MKTTNILTAFMVLFALMLTSVVNAVEHTVNAQAREFKPAIVYIQPGDTVNFKNMTSHNAVSYLIPDGAAEFGERGKFPGGSFNVALDIPGIYGYVCEPHIGFGMVGVIVVGDVSPDDIAAAKDKAMETLEGPFKRIIGKINKIRPVK